MADIGIANCTVTKAGPGPGEILEWFLVTPATADSNDSVVVTTLLGTVQSIYAWDITSGDQVTATDSSGTITIDTGGGTTDHSYSLIIVGTQA